MNIQSKLLIGLLSILFILYAEDFTIAQETKSAPKELQDTKTKLLTHEQIISEAQRSVDRSLTIMDYTISAIGVLVGLLTLIVVVMGGIFGFFGFKTFSRLREDIEKIKDIAGKSETKYKEAEETLSKVKPMVDNIANIEKDMNGIKEEFENEFRDLSTSEKPTGEIKDKLDELAEKSEFLEGVGVKLGPEDYYTRGLDYFYKGEYEKAEEAFRKATKLKPDDAEAWFSRGAALDNIGQFEEAVKSYDKAIVLIPDYADAWNNRGVTLNNLGQFEEAVKSCDKAILLEPDFAMAWDNKGVAFNKLGKYDEAIKHHDMAIELKPDNANAWYNKACAYSLKGDKGKSLENLRKAVALDSTKYKEMSKKDEDFKGLRDNEEFKKIVE